MYNKFGRKEIFYLNSICLVHSSIYTCYENNMNIKNSLEYNSVIHILEFVYFLCYTYTQE